MTDGGSGFLANAHRFVHGVVACGKTARHSSPESAALVYRTDPRVTIITHTVASRDETGDTWVWTVLRKKTGCVHVRDVCFWCPGRQDAGDDFPTIAETVGKAKIGQDKGKSRKQILLHPAGGLRLSSFTSRRFCCSVTKARHVVLRVGYLLLLFLLNCFFIDAA